MPNRVGRAAREVSNGFRTWNGWKALKFVAKLSHAAKRCQRNSGGSEYEVPARFQDSLFSHRLWYSIQGVAVRGVNDGSGRRTASAVDEG